MIRKILPLFFVTSLSGVTFSKPKHFQHTKSTALVKHFLISEHLSYTQLLHLMHKMKFLPTPFLHSEHGNLEAFIAAALLSV